MNETALRSPSEIPLKFRHIFAQYETFNKVQSKVIDKVLYTDDPLVISAPTGSGKTAVFELAILRVLMRIEELRYEGDFKIIYVAPVKALCMEKFADWQAKFESVGVKCLEATGDSDVGDFSCLMSAQLVVTTPEKWDSLTRKWKDAEGVVEAVKLFLIDEVHLVNEDVRGPILEAIVSRMKTIQFSMRLKRTRSDFGLRLIAVSATIPNIEDLADWLGEEKPASFYQISEAMRPVQLQRHVLGFNTSAQGFRFDMNLNYKLAAVIKKFSNEKPTLIFCNSRKSVEMATKVLADDHCLISLSDMQKIALQQISRSIQDGKLKQFLIKGIAYHHAGVSYQDRGVVEDAFRKSFILVLVCTNTLAMGVNFPAHLVIVKSTENYVGGKSREYTESAILQMIGRAGRPQYDMNGVAVIMTQQKNVKKYENLMNGCTPIESHLHKHLAEHLNSEIVLQTVTDLSVAMKWIRSTFLYVRAVKCAVNYGFAHGMPREAVEKKLEEMCVSHIEALEQFGLIVKDHTYGLSMASTSIGRLMARYYVSFDTMKIFRQIIGNEGLLDTLNIIIRAKEFKEFTLRVNDKKILNALNNHPIRFPIKGKIKTCENKISCLIQAVFGNINVQDSSMMQDALRMVRLGEKLSKCFSEYIRLSETYYCGKIYKALSNSTTISKCFRAKLWNNSEFLSKQLKNIGPVYSSLLVNAGKTTIQSILEMGARKIEMVIGKAPPFGDQIIESLSAFPHYSMELSRKSESFLLVIVKQINRQYIYEGQNAVLIVGDADNHLLFYNCKVDQIICEEGLFEKVVPIKNEHTKFVQAKLIHESLVGMDHEEKIMLNPDAELFETKRSNARKVQTKIKLKKMKTTPVTTSKVKDYDELGDHDEYFDDIIALGEDPTVKEKEIDKRAKNYAESSKEAFKRKLQCFESIPIRKMAKTEVFLEKLIDSKKSPIVDESFEAEELDFPRDDLMIQENMDGELLQELFENELQMENDFIASQVSKYKKEVKDIESSSSLMQPLDLRLNKNELSSVEVVPPNNSNIVVHEKSCYFGLKGNTIRKGVEFTINTPASLHSYVSHNSKMPSWNPSDNVDLEIIGNFSTKPLNKQRHSNDVSINNKKIENKEATHSKGFQSADKFSSNLPFKTTQSRGNHSTYLKAKLNLFEEPPSPRPEISPISLGYICKCITKNLQCSARSRPNSLSTKTSDKVPRFASKLRPEIFKRPNLAKLRDMSSAVDQRKYISSTLPPKETSGYTEYLKRTGQSYVVDKKVSNNHQGYTQMSVAFKSNAKNISGSSKAARFTYTSTLSCPSIFNTPQKKTLNPHLRNTTLILPRMCEKFIENDNATINAAAFLKKLEEDLCFDGYDEEPRGKNKMIENFFDDRIPISLEKPFPFGQPNASSTKNQVANIMKFRLSNQQPIFNKILKIKTEPRNVSLPYLPLQPTSNPANERIDKILQNVVQEPFKHISNVIHNPYRIKLPKRHNTVKVTTRPKQNFEFFENFRRRSELERLNSKFKDSRERGDKYMAQMSTILLADHEARDKSTAEVLQLNTAALPKPDFEVFEKAARNEKFVRNTRNSTDERSLEFIRSHEYKKNTPAISQNFGPRFVFESLDNDTSFIDPDALGFTHDAQKKYPSARTRKTLYDFHGNLRVSSATTLTRTPRKINFENFDRIDPSAAVKLEPLSPSFEALSLLDTNDLLDAAIGFEPANVESALETTQDFINLAPSPMTDVLLDLIPQSQDRCRNLLDGGHLLSKDFFSFQSDEFVEKV